MTGLDAFGVGVAIGIVLGLIGAFAVVLLLAYRDGHPLGDMVRDDDPDDPPTRLDGWHGQEAP